MSGKGSGRRNEDSEKVRSNWGNIDWSATRKDEDKQQDTKEVKEKENNDNK